MKFDWKPISEIPEEYKDGREVLCRALDFYATTEPVTSPDDSRLVHTVMTWEAWVGRFTGYYDGNSPVAVYYCTALDKDVEEEIFVVNGFMLHSDSDWVQSYHRTREGAEKACAEAQAKEDTGDKDFGYAVHGPFKLKD